jgi:hypothetical protein
MKIPILTLNTPNKNGRVYPREVFEKALAKYKKEFIDERRAMVVKRQPECAITNLLDVVGVIKEITFEGDKVMAEVEFLPNVPDGLSCEAGVKCGKLSLRTGGLGTLDKKEDGTYVIREDYEITHCFLTDDPA